MIDARKRYITPSGGIKACMAVMALAGLPFAGAVLMHEEVDAFMRWNPATMVLLLAFIPVLLAGRR